MAKIQINEFKGIMPKLANDKLPQNMAQIASDLKTASGELVAIKASTADVTLPGTEYKSLFQYLEGSNSHWVYTNDINHAVRSPIADDTFERMYYTGTSGEYRAFSNDIISGGGFDFTTDFYTPGAPAGQAPTLAGYTGGGTTFRSYFYTFVSRYAEEGPGSELAEVTDYTSGRMQINDITLPTQGHLITATESPTFLNRPKIRVYRTASAGDGTASFLLVCEAEWFDTIHTYVAGDFVFRDTGGGTYDLYECTVGGIGAAATFVQGELVADSDLGSTTNAYLWDQAPADLTNLRSHPNGFLVASKGKTLHFTEAFSPWAWPEDYQIPLPANIVGLGVYGSTIVVATDANIYTYSGPHPTSLYKQKLSFQPCLSQRGVVETDEGVMFPAAEGFQLVNQNGPQNVTADLFSPEDWDDFELETLHGVWYNKAYYGFFKDEVEGNIRIDFLNQSITTGADYHWATNVSLADGIFRTAFASDITSMALQISQWDNDPNRFRNYQYKSPRFILEKPANFKVAQVILDTDFYNKVLGIIADSGSLSDLNTTLFASELKNTLNSFTVNEESVNGDTLFDLASLGVQDYVEFNVYVNSVLKFTKQIRNSQMFKLPRGFKHKKWEIELIGMIPVKRVTMATSTEEIV